ncbi:hypothetical protein M2352_001536 [Azospirillum fermentarium]|uniref:hypothetical protein n=1 Tax=Azospirillum fermentarium TaxID=1233114 RepID=UPI0022275F5D|nr:hypothetical protein [Azospirillum fermentarium]MCW2245945.1 hypothetical protein [Azospirillum fermentarium]
MSIDRTELDRLMAERPAGNRSAMQAVRDCYGDISLMRERGLSWADISGILARLGITTRDNNPISPVTLRSAFFLVGNEIRSGASVTEEGGATAETIAAVHAAALAAGLPVDGEGDEPPPTPEPDVQPDSQPDEPAPEPEPLPEPERGGESPAPAVPSLLSPVTDSDEAPTVADAPVTRVGADDAADEAAAPAPEPPLPAPVPEPVAEAPAAEPASEPVKPLKDFDLLAPAPRDDPPPPPVAVQEDEPEPEPEPELPPPEPAPAPPPPPPPVPKAVAIAPAVVIEPASVAVSPSDRTDRLWKGDFMLGTIFVLNDRGGVGKTLLSHHLMATAMLEGLQLKVVEYEVNERLARLFGPEIVEHRRITQDFMNMMGSGDGFYEFWDQIGPELQRGGRLFDFGGNISQWFFNWAEVSGFDYYVGEGERLTFMIPVTVDLASLSTGMATLDRIAAIAPKAKRVIVENAFSGPFTQLEDSQYARRKAELQEREGVDFISMPPCTAPAWARLTGHRLDQVAQMTREDLVKLGMTPPVASRSLIIIHDWLRTMRQSLAPYLIDAFRQTPGAAKPAR